VFFVFLQVLCDTQKNCAHGERALITLASLVCKFFFLFLFFRKMMAEMINEMMNEMMNEKIIKGADKNLRQSF